LHSHRGGRLEREGLSAFIPIPRFSILHFIYIGHILIFLFAARGQASEPII
jgi:hypothetical protein